MYRCTDRPASWITFDIRRSGGCLVVDGSGYNSDRSVLAVSKSKVFLRVPI